MRTFTTFRNSRRLQTVLLAAAATFLLSASAASAATVTDTDTVTGLSVTLTGTELTATAGANTDPRYLALLQGRSAIALCYANVREAQPFFDGGVLRQERPASGAAAIVWQRIVWPADATSAQFHFTQDISGSVDACDLRSDLFVLPIIGSFGFNDIGRQYVTAQRDLFQEDFRPARQTKTALALVSNSLQASVAHKKRIVTGTELRGIVKYAYYNGAVRSARTVAVVADTPYRPKTLFIVTGASNRKRITLAMKDSDGVTHVLVVTRKAATLDGSPVNY